MLRHPNYRCALAIVLFACELVTATPAHAGSDLKLAYGVASEQDTGARTPVPGVEPNIDAPLRLEYELRAHVERINQTTQELRAVVESMPGPMLPSADTTAPDEQRYASPIEETLARLNHVEQLVADITRIIESMPLAGGAKPSRPSAPSPKPHPLPKPAPDTPASVATVRSIALFIGGLIAVVLAIHLRKRFLRRRPTRKDLAASIDLPHLKDEALELADIMSSMGLADGAAHALVERIRSNPRQALAHWLKLLDVYRQTGKKAEFENAAQEMRNAFNVKPGTWESKEHPAERDASLETYPHIAAQLKKLWPTPACTEYLLSLLADNRDGKRAGFPLAVVEEIVLLLAVLRYEEQPD